MKCSYCGNNVKMAYKGTCPKCPKDMKIGVTQTVLNREEINLILDCISFRLLTGTENPHISHDLNVVYNILIESHKLIVEKS
jgi:hypothetical protein